MMQLLLLNFFFYIHVHLHKVHDYVHLLNKQVPLHVSVKWVCSKNFINSTSTTVLSLGPSMREFPVRQSHWYDAILTVTRLLKEQVALLEFHDPLIVVHEGGDFLRQLEGQGLEASGLSPMHHHCTSGLIKRGLKETTDTIKNHYHMYPIWSSTTAYKEYYQFNRVGQWMVTMQQQVLWTRMTTICKFT